MRRFTHLDAFIDAYEQNKRRFKEFLKKSPSVARTRQLLNQLYEDLKAISELPDDDDLDNMTEEMEEIIE